MLKEYQKFVSKGILEATKEREPVVAFALGLTGETGEVVDDIKKRIFHGRDIPLEHTAEEIGDVMWYVANICNVYGFNLEDILKQNMEKLRKRYPDKYEEPVGDWTDNTDEFFAYRRNGPHIEKYDVRTGRHIKFVSIKELPPAIAARFISEDTEAVKYAATQQMQNGALLSVASKHKEDCPFD